MGSCLSGSSNVAGDTVKSDRKNQKGEPKEKSPVPVEKEKQQEVESDVVEVTLKKHPGGCTGLFWREDPTKATTLQGGYNWPRDNAKLRGKVVVVDEEKWLLVSHVKQVDSSTWEEAPLGAAMPFEIQHYYLE
jgi:hypothetical protein